MGNLFSGHGHGHKHATPPASAITDADRAMLSLKTQRRRLEDQQKLLEKRIDRYAEVARELLKEARRERALLALRKKKMSENQMQQLEKLLLNIEGVLSSMELARQQNRVFSVLQQGNEALKELQQQVKLDDVKQLMEDSADAKAYQDEMSSILAQSLSGEDDAAVAAELQELEDLQMAAEAAEMPQAPKVPPQAAAAAAAAAKAQQSQEAEAEQEEEEEEAEPAAKQRLAPLAAS